MFTTKIIFGAVAGVFMLGTQADAQCFSRRCIPQRIVRVSPVNPCYQCRPVYRRVVRSQVYRQVAPAPAPCCAPACGGGAAYGGEVVSQPAPVVYSGSRDISELRTRVQILENEAGISYGP